MNASSEEFHIVFVIDVKGRHEKGAGEYITDHTIKSIQLAGLKLLTYFSNKATRSVLKWGVKYFNFCGKTEQIRKCGFKDFSGKTYEEFEAEVERLLHSETLKLDNRVKSPHKNKLKQMTAFMIDEDSIYNDINLIGDADDEKHPSMKIREALQQTALEFNWDRPLTVLGSPVRGKRLHPHTGGISLDSNKLGTIPGNHIFLFTPCPQSINDLCHFTECYRDDFQPHCNAFITRNLQRDLQLSRKINVHWVNIVDNSVQTQDFRGIEMVDKIFCGLGGGVLPIETIIQLKSSFDRLLLPAFVSLKGTHDAAISQSNPKRSCFFLPFSSALDYYLAKAKSCPDRDQLDLNKNYTLLTLLCNMNGDSPNILCALSLHSMVKPDSPRQNVNVGINCTKKSVARSSNEIGLNIQQHHSEDCSTMTIDTSDTVIVNTMPQTVQTTHPVYNTYQISGTIKIGALPLDSFDCDKVYCCTGRKFDGRKYLVTEETSDVFQTLLMELFKQRLNLVLEDCSPVAFPRKMILQPLTPVSATVTSIRPDRVLQLEKLLSLPSPDNTEQSEDLKNFVNKSVKHIQAGFGLGTGTYQPDPIKVNSTDSTLGLSDRDVFHCPTMELWNQPESRLKVAGLVQEFRPSPSIKKFDSHLQKKLAKFYQRVDQPKTMSGQIKHGEIENTQKGDNEVAGASESRKKQLERLASSIKTTRGKHLVDTIHHIKTSQRKSESDINSTSVDVEEMRQKKHEAKVKERRDRIKENIAKHDITEESSLFESLRANYSQCISGSISPVSCAQSLVNVIVHFSKSTHPGNYSDKSRGLLNEQFLKSYKSMRDNHMTASGADESMKIAEYQLQVLLRIELKSALLDGEEEVEDEWLEEIANMLRKAAFSSDTTFLPQFLKEVVLENYVYVLPKTVGKIYEELMTEPPEEYSYLLSCENSDKDDSMNQHENSEVSLSVPMSLRSSSSIGSCSNDPWSNKSGRSRSLVSQSSFTDTNLKRQIMVPLVKKPKVEKAKSRDTKVVTRSSAKKKSARKKKIADPKVEVTKVKRNLFLGGDLEGLSVSGKTNRLERRHTMAAIPSTGSSTPRKSSTPGKQTPKKTPRKTPCKSTPKKMSPRHPRHSRKPRLRHHSGHMVKEHHILKTKMVSETPRHKQVGQALRRQERQRSQTVQEVAVVEESPEKEDNIENAEPNTSLPLNISQIVSEKHKVKSKPVLARRASFYSESSRNLQKHRELARRIAGHQPVIPLQPQMKLKLKTPVRKRGDFLLTQLRKSSEKKTENGGDNIGVKKSTPLKSDLAETRIDAAVTPRRATKKALFLSPAKTPTRNQTSTPRGSVKKDTVHQTRGTPRKSPKKSRTPSSAKRKVFDKQITTPVKSPSLHDLQRSTSAKKFDMRDAEAPDKLSSPQHVTPVKDKCDFEWLTSVGTTPKKADDNFGAVEISVPDTPSRNTRSRTEAEQCYMPRNKSDASKCFIQDTKPEDMNLGESEFSTKIAKPSEIICEDNSAVKGDILNECHTVDLKPTSRSHQKRTPSTSKKSRKKRDSASGVEDGNDTTPMKGQLSIKTFLQHTPPSEALATSVSPFTPPPSRSQTTPDTFDKWHRRKSRYSLNSPATAKGRASAITKGSVSSPPSPFSTNIQAKSKKRGKPRKNSPSTSQKTSCDNDEVYLLDSNLTSSGEESIGTFAHVQNKNEDSSVSFHEYMAFLSPSHRKTRKAAQEGKMSDDESVIHFKVPEDQGFSLFDPESAIQYNINVAKQVLRPGEDFSPVTVHKKEILYKTETTENDEEGSQTLKKDAIDSRRIRKSLSRSSFGSIEPRLHSSTKRGLEKEYTSFELAGRHFPSTGGDMAGQSSCDDSSKENKLLSRKRMWTSPGDRRLSKRRRTNTNSSPCYSENSLDNVSVESEDVFLSENISFTPSSSSNSDLYTTHPGNRKSKKSNFQLFGDAETGESPVHHRIHSLRKGLARSSSGNISHASSNDGFECDGDNNTSNLSLQSLSGKLQEKARTDQMQSPQESKKSSPKYSPVSAMGLLGLINSPIINSEDMGMKTTVDRAGDGEKRPRSRRTLNMKSNLS